jgi:hypothetical protein
MGKSLVVILLEAKPMRADDNGGTIDNIRKTVHIHPALSEVVSRAAADIHRI